MRSTAKTPSQFSVPLKALEGPQAAEGSWYGDVTASYLETGRIRLGLQRLSASVLLAVAELFVPVLDDSDTGQDFHLVESHPVFGTARAGILGSIFEQGVESYEEAPRKLSRIVSGLGSRRSPDSPVQRWFDETEA